MTVLISSVTVVSLIVTALYAIGSIAVAFVLGKRVSKVEKWVLAWLVFDALIHFTLEGPFLFFSLTGTVEKSENSLALLWKEYGKADKRWLVSDPTIVSLELLTVLIDGPLCLLLVYAILKKKFYRHFVQIVLCVCELYGGWMTFCPDWLLGSPNLVTSNFLYMWVYLVFFNGVWIIIPFALLWQSWKDMKAVFPEGKVWGPTGKGKDKSNGKKYNLRKKAE